MMLLWGIQSAKSLSSSMSLLQCPGCRGCSQGCSSHAWLQQGLLVLFKKLILHIPPMYQPCRD